MSAELVRLILENTTYLACDRTTQAELVGVEVRDGRVDPAELPVEVLKELYPLWELQDSPVPEAALRTCQRISSGGMKSFTYLDLDPTRRQVKLCTARGGMFRSYSVRGLVLNYSRFKTPMDQITFPEDVVEVVPGVFQHITMSLFDLTYEELSPSDEASLSQTPSSQRRTLYDVDDGWAVLVMLDEEAAPPIKQFGYRLVKGRSCLIAKNRLRSMVALLDSFPELENPFRRVGNPAEQVEPPSQAIEESVLVVVDPTRMRRGAVEAT